MSSPGPDGDTPVLAVGDDAEPAFASRIAERRRAALADGGADYNARRARLIAAAGEVFRAKGYAAASLNDIARAIGIPRANLYYYVASKEELFEECIADAVDSNIRAAEAIAAQALTPRQQLEALIALFIRSQAEHYPYLFVYVQEDMRRISAEDARWATRMAAATRRIEGFVVDAIAAGVKDGSFTLELPPALVANALFGMTWWTHRWWAPDGRFGAAELVRTFTAVLFDGIDRRR